MFFPQLSCSLWSPTESVNLLARSHEYGNYSNPLKINLRWTMEKWQLGTNFPFFVSPHAVARWHQEYTLVVYCFCGISTIHVPLRWNVGQDYGHTHACAQKSTSASVIQLLTVQWIKWFTLKAYIFFCLFYLNLLNRGCHQALQIIPAYKYFQLPPSGVSISLLPDLGKAGHISAGLLLFREKEQHPTHARCMNAISQALTKRRTPPRPSFWSLWLFCHPNHKRSFSNTLHSQARIYSFMLVTLKYID